MPTSSRAARITLYVVLSFVVFAGVTSAITQWRARNADEARQSATERSDEIARCVGGYRVRYVDAPETRSRDAEKKALALIAAGQADGPAFLKAVDRFASETADVDRFERLNRFARLHPEAFVRACRHDNP